MDGLGGQSPDVIGRELEELSELKQAPSIPADPRGRLGVRRVVGHSPGSGVGRGGLEGSEKGRKAAVNAPGGAANALNPCHLIEEPHRQVLNQVNGMLMLPGIVRV